MMGGGRSTSGVLHGEDMVGDKDGECGAVGCGCVLSGSRERLLNSRQRV